MDLVLILGLTLALIVGIVVLIWVLRFARWLRRGRTHPRITSSAYIGGVERDTWEGAFWDAHNPRDLKLNLLIDYRNGEGVPTRRRITTRSFDSGRFEGLIIAHCHLRNATRTFRIDRVEAAVDTDTGEVIESLREYLELAYARSPDRARERFLADHAELLKVLFYVAKADGRFMREEKAVVREHLRGLIRDPRMTDPVVDSLFTGMEVPSPQSFKVAVGRALSEQLMPPEGLLDACRAIVATQKTASVGEQEALRYIEERVQQYARSGYGA